MPSEIRSATIQAASRHQRVTCTACVGKRLVDEACAEWGAPGCTSVSNRRSLARRGLIWSHLNFYLHIQDYLAMKIDLMPAVGLWGVYPMVG
jgi:hypothetical protein